MKVLDLIEDFKDLGKMSDELLGKGHKLNPEDEGNFTQVTGRVFHRILSKYADRDKLREHPKGMSDLSIYGADQYLAMECYVGKNNTSGYALTDTKELVSVFSFMKSSGDAIVKDAVRNGAKHLDCFAYMDDEGNISGKLYKLYKRHGFKLNRELSKGGEYPVDKGISIVEGAQDGEPNVVVYMIR